MVDEKDSVFRTKRGKKTPEKLLDNKDETDETNMDDDGKQNLISLDSTIQNKQSKMYSGIDSNERDEINHRKISLDQAFQNLRATKSKNKGQIKIVSRFSFICSPQQECIIKGTKPNVIEFSEAISSTNEAAVISLGVILKKFIGKNKKTALLYLTSEKPVILRKVLLEANLLDNVVHVEDVKMFLEEDKEITSEMVLSSCFHNVNGMEFDFVILLLTYSEYYLKYYLPQAMSRCSYDLSLVFLPKPKQNIKKHLAEKLHNHFSKNEITKRKNTIENIKKEWQKNNLIKQWNVVECQRCETVSELLTENDKTLTVHSHSCQYQTHLDQLKKKQKSRNQSPVATAPCKSN